ncbi:GGDEF domain-containing protein [Vibrio navarrensis]|uniref:GGDEF domain-containing protein n=1 Tax=Vibrio navarrensis TaxID=29495 RepID=UPI00051DC8EE|nr:GGDEF domain-containing protein [Vibrio navarrensis]KGK14114.1 diguanylate cyclase [Vibrio navarrensis]
MANLAGQHIEEMADIRLTRKRKIVSICSLSACGLFLYHTIEQSLTAHLTIALINGSFALLSLVVFVYLQRSRKGLNAELFLSAILLLGAIPMIFHTTPNPDRLLWLFPILSTVILINRFKIGLLLNSLFCLTICLTLLVSHPTPGYPIQTAYSLVVALIVTSLICHAFAFYHYRLINYVHSLYLEGIEDLAYTDKLTGLANRWSFESWAKEKLQEIDATPTSGITALVFIDIDDFKVINDNYGHDIGDKVLQHFAQRLKNNIRNKDRRTDKHDYSIARFAGDEFVLMLYDVKSRQDLDNILKRIITLYHSGYQANERIHGLTLSLGAAIYGLDAFELSELTRCADKAMYKAKHAGKNRFAYYNEDEQTQADHASAPHTDENASLTDTASNISHFTPRHRPSKY